MHITPNPARAKPHGQISITPINRLIVRPDGLAIMEAAGGWCRPRALHLALAASPLLQLGGFRLGMEG